MEFSLIFEAQLTDPTRERERRLLLDCVDQAVYAEQMGFDRIWAVEHHSLRWYAHMSAPEVFLTWVAARTSTIRIGHGVVCMPFNYNHPIRVAERAAMLDSLSGGRLDLGGGRGATLQEMSLMGVDPEDTYAQMEEALRIIGHVWLEDEFEWHGLLDIEPHPVLPRPVQDPHPPLFLACTKRDTVTLAADLGVGSLVMGFAGPGEVGALRKDYDAAWDARTGARSVSPVTNKHFTALCPTIVLDDAAEAFQVGARAQRFFAESIGHWYGHAPPPSEAVVPGEDSVAEITVAREAYVAQLHEAKIPVGPHTTSTYNVDQAYGDAGAAIEYVRQLRDAGADEIMCLVQMGTVSQDVCIETIRQWGERVIPEFR
jgi:alkanesulfonate monooxygenase SsuD/methylene tetrahydromethanopterin reductase-like flavin-dependent oxidoreductase (luciferase family)